MVPCGRRLVPVAVAVLLLLPPLAGGAGILADVQRGPGKILLNEDDSGAVTLRADGTIEAVDLTTGQVRALRASGNGAFPTDIARPGKGTVVYAIVPRLDGKTTTLEAHDVGGEAGPTLVIKGRGHFLEITQDGRFACIAGTKAGGKDAAPDHWHLTVVDIATGEVPPPIPIGFVPTAMALRGRDGILARLFVAGDDRVATFSMVPPRPSWFYRSPGRNQDIALPAGTAVVWLLRDSSFAVIDPERWERDEGRVRSHADDATAIVDLGWFGASIAMSPDGRFAAVLAQDGRTIALIDVAVAKIDRAMALVGDRDLVARVMAAPVDDAGDPRLLLASSESRGSQPSWVDIPVPAQPEPIEVAAAAAIPPTPAASAPVGSEEPQPDDAARDMTASPPQSFPTAAEMKSLPPPPSKPDASAPPPGNSQPVKPVESAAAPPAGSQAEKPAESTPPPESPQPEKPAESASKRPPEPPISEKPAESAPPSPPQEKAAETELAQPPPSGEAPQEPAPDRALSGRVRGEIPAGLEVLLYGPNNVLRLGGRALVASDGQWRLPLPAPGRYRVVVSAGSERHVFASPEFRTIAITGSGEGMADIDFEIRGSM